MSRPVFVKLGGSAITDKDKEGTMRRPVARRLCTELRKADVPLVLFHGAGSYGHPLAKRWEIGKRPITVDRRAGVSETLASVTRLHAEVLDLAAKADLRPVSIPLHLTATSAAGMLENLPVNRIQDLLDEGFTPVMHGTAVRDDALGWRIVSADEIMAELAPDLRPRLAVFATDVDGIYPPGAQGGEVLAEVSSVDDVGAASGRRDDVTGAMVGKVRQGLMVASVCPTLVVNGLVRNRLLDTLKGKPVPCTRLVA